VGILAGFSAVAQLARTGSKIAPLPSLEVQRIPGVAIGYITAVVFSVVVVVAFFDTV
jgi:hypothetical protein